MDVLLPIAAKSFILAGAALLILRLAGRRSAAERSWIAHLGLAAVLMLPLAALVLPGLHVETPAFVGAPAADAGTASAALEGSTLGAEAAPAAARFPEAAAPGAAAGADWLFWLYAAPAGLLVLLTLIALGRLFTLRARADVLVEPHWLTALARAQHRMRFKHGTALLTSDELPSPISWGVMRPVILLNREAADSHREAEAIIAHELAHVASLDWAKLLLSRVTTALFWFNPFVWLLAREAHQLREEAADDAVLGADIIDTDYAQLLVGVARHECRGLLLGAHGVAPARNSLARRVRRVLDAGSARGPVGRAFALGMFSGAVVLAAPLGALTLGPAPESDLGTSAPPRLQAVAALPGPVLASPAVAEAPVLAMPSSRSAANAAVQAAAGAAAVAGAVHPHPGAGMEDGTSLASPGGARVERSSGRTVMTAPDGGIITIHPPDARGLQKVVMRSAAGGVLTYPDVRKVPGLSGPNLAPRARARTVDNVVALKATGVTPEYVAAIRAASPALRHLEAGDMVALKATGVTPAYVREIGALARIEADELAGARAVGVTGDYVRSLAAAGFRGFSLDELTRMRAVGVTAADLAAYKRSGGRFSVDAVVDRKVDRDDPGPEDAWDGPDPGG